MYKTDMYKIFIKKYAYIYFGCGPLPITVTTRIITFLVVDSYKPSFATGTGMGG